MIGQIFQANINVILQIICVYAEAAISTMTSLPIKHGRQGG